MRSAMSVVLPRAIFSYLIIQIQRMIVCWYVLALRLGHRSRRQISVLDAGRFVYIRLCDFCCCCCCCCLAQTNACVWFYIKEREQFNSAFIDICTLRWPSQKKLSEATLVIHLSNSTSVSLWLLLWSVSKRSFFVLNIQWIFRELCSLFSAENAVPTFGFNGNCIAVLLCLLLGHQKQRLFCQAWGATHEAGVSRG